MKENSDFVRRVVPPLAAWAVAKLLETPALRASVRSVDRNVDHHRKRATEAVRRAGKTAVDNAIENGVWLAAGVIAVAAGIALIARATRPR